MALPAGYLNEIEPAAMILVGFVLFVIPEPVSSTLGAGLMLLGISWLFMEWRREPETDAETEAEPESSIETT